MELYKHSWSDKDVHTWMHSSEVLHVRILAFSSVTIDMFENTLQSVYIVH